MGLLAALAMVLGYLETFIPIPIPGVKLGLANIAVLVALARGDVPGAFCVGIIKVLSTGFLFGNPVTMAYSAVGTLLAFAAMAPLSKIRGLSIVFVSVAGALAHEAGQLVVAMALLGTPLVWYSAPVLVVAGCITGALCGAVTARALAAVDDLPGQDDAHGAAPRPAGGADDPGSALGAAPQPAGGADDPGSALGAAPQPAGEGPIAESGHPRCSAFPPGESPANEILVDDGGTGGAGGGAQGCSGAATGLAADGTTFSNSAFSGLRSSSGARRITVNPKAALIAFIVFAIAVLHLQGIPALAGALVVAAVAAAAGRVRTGMLAKALRPTLFILVITLMAQVASLQAGDVLVQLGPVSITAQALEQTAIMVLRLLTVVVASAAVMAIASPGGLVDAIAWLLGPLSRAGMRTEGFVFALEVALATVPALVGAIENRDWNWRDWKTAVPAFIAQHI